MRSTRSLAYGGSLFVGVAGGSASGKSTVVAQLVARLGDDLATVVAHDRYYRDCRARVASEPVNFDHPDALETERLVADLRTLANGRSINAPIYDFAQHARLRRTDPIAPRPVVMVEGLFVLAERQIRELCDLRVFVDVPDDQRFARRLWRDTAERGRAPSYVRRQYERAVRPMHMAFVEPSRAYADFVVTEGGFNRTALDQLGRTIADMLARRRAGT